MNVVSSHRPMGDDQEIARNQMLAKRSWEIWAKRIVYFGTNDFELRSSKTAFVESEQFPRIKSLIEAACGMVGFTAIVNADIVIKPDIRRLEQMMMLRGKLCASSRRYHFNPNTCNWDSAELGNDRGRDVFIARHDVWKRAFKLIPDAFRIGNGRWDGFLTDLFRNQHNDAFIDFTQKRLVYHPIHGNRRRPYDEEIAKVHYEL